MANIGFIGLGIMGVPMAVNLQQKGGNKLFVNDKKAPPAVLLDGGAVACANGAEVAKQSDIVFIMVPDTPDVEAVLFGENGVAQGLSAGKIVVDMSSISPIATKEFAKKINDLGCEYLDAPVSGGEPKAIDGTVAFMVGGDENTFEKYKEILFKMGSSVTRCGELGAGNTTKLANQIIVAGNIQAVSEAFILAKKAGVNPECVFEAIKGGLAGSTVMNAKVPMMINDDVKPGFRVDLHIKDLNNALECAHSVGAVVPMTSQIQEIMQYLHNNGDGSSDHSAIIHYYEKLADIKL